MRMTDTFVRESGKWQVVASQTTLVPSDSATSAAKPASHPSKASIIGTTTAGVGARRGRKNARQFHILGALAHVCLITPDCLVVHRSVVMPDH